ncbi:MAG: galactokinase [Ruminococcaceae bacterium]|nr:galactokinase [Oscillospiraceae bacterium]
MSVDDVLIDLRNGKYDPQLEKLYGIMAVPKQRLRYENAVMEFARQFPHRVDSDISLFSAPGRTEIGGNHTDHQHGCVLAAAVDLDVIAVVSFHNEKIIRVKSKGYDLDEVVLNDTTVCESEKGSSAALIRGIAAQFINEMVNIGGFDAYTTSDILSGSGLSSSAAFEILIGTIIDSRFEGGSSKPIKLAKIGQYAENIYYGKKCGLMDQAVCAAGGLVFIDFHNIEDPMIQKYDADLSEYGYEICITDTRGSHSDLTDEYSAISDEMEQIAEYFGCKHLRDVNESEFERSISDLRKLCSDRAILRVMHFFEENRRAQRESAALKDGNIESFLSLVNQSGISSETLLQNLYSAKRPTEQAIPLAIALSRKILNEKGAVRVHGGGFAGTIQALVPSEDVEHYKSQMEAIFGKDCCYVLHIRKSGGVQVIGNTEKLSEVG